MCQVIWPFSFTINSIRLESGHLIGCSALQWGQKGPSPLQRISSSASLLNIWAYTPYDNVSRVSRCHPTLTPPQHNQQVTMQALYFYVICQGTFINYVGLHLWIKSTNKRKVVLSNIQWIFNSEGPAKLSWSQFVLAVLSFPGCSAFWRLVDHAHRAGEFLGWWQEWLENPSPGFTFLPSELVQIDLSSSQSTVKCLS